MKTKYLKDTLSCAMEGDDNLEELKYVNFAQDRLLQIASGMKEKSNSYKMKSEVFKQRGHIESAIFYNQKALNECDNQTSFEQVSELQVEEAYLFLSLIEKKRKYKFEDEVVIGEAREKIDKIDDFSQKKEKADLEHEFQRLTIEKIFSNSGCDEVVENLRRTRTEFEAKVKQNQTDENLLQENLRKPTFSVFHDSKVVLERCMHYIRDNIFPDGKEYIYYPARLKDVTLQDIDRNFKSIGWFQITNSSHLSFSSILPKLAEFFVDKLDNEKYPELLQFVDIRNKGEHDFEKNQIKEMQQHCPDVVKQIKLSRDACNYAAEVWKVVKREVDEYLLNMKKED